MNFARNKTFDRNCQLSQTVVGMPLVGAEDLHAKTAQVCRRLCNALQTSNFEQTLVPRTNWPKTSRRSTGSASAPNWNSNICESHTGFRPEMI